MPDDESEVYPPCHCGREVRKLNAASDTPKCVGCGYVPEICRCDRPAPTGRALKREEQIRRQYERGRFHVPKGDGYA